jgi:hypothetical protein
MLHLVLGYQLSVEQVRSTSVTNVDLQQDNYLNYANTRGLIEPIYPNFNKPSPILEEQLVEIAAKAANLPAKAASPVSLPVKAANK